MIKKFRLTYGGIKGASVTYRQTENVGDKDYDNTITKQNAQPVPREIIDEMAKLRIHVLSVSDFWKENWNTQYDFEKHVLKIDDSLDDNTKSRLRKTINECYITGIDFGDERFSVHFTMPRTDNPRVKININTETIKRDDGYDMFDDMYAIVGKCAELIMDYINNDLIADESMIGFSVIKNNSDMTDEQALETFESLSEDKKKEILAVHIEGTGMANLDEILEGVSEDDGTDEVEVVDFEESKEEPEDEAPEEVEAEVVEEEQLDRKKPKAEAEVLEEDVVIPSESEEVSDTKF